MHERTAYNPLTNRQFLSGDVTDRCRDVLGFMSVALLAIGGSEVYELNEDTANGAALTLGMVSNALQEIEDCKLRWGGEAAGGEAQS